MGNRTGAGSKFTEDRGRLQYSNVALSKYQLGLLWAATVSAVTCLFGLGALVLFTNPADNANLAALYVFCLCGSFLGSWAAGYWLRIWVGHRSFSKSWRCTRQASLISLGVIGSLLLLQVGWFGIPAIISMAVALVGLELFFTWMEMNR